MNTKGVSLQTFPSLDLCRFLRRFSAVTPWGEILIAIKVDVQHSQLDPVDGQLLSVADFVTDCVQPSLCVALPGLVFLIEALRCVTSPVGPIVDMIESVGSSGCYALWSMYLQSGVFEANVKLVILQTPPPVFVGHPVDNSKVAVAEQQNSADEGRL